MTDPSGWTFRRLSDHRAILGESPILFGGAVWWVDIDGRALCRTDPASGTTETWTMPELIGFVAPAPDSGLIIGMQTGLFRFAPDTGPILLHALGQTGIRYNDATSDGLGRIWCGTMDIDNAQPVGTLYRLETDMSLTQIAEGFTTINGLAADDAAGRLYISDSHQSVQRVWTLPLDANSDTRQPFVDFAPLAGRPDGGTIGPDGRYWVAGVSGGVVHAFDPDGTHAAQIPTPMPDPTKLIFSSANRGYLTSKTDAPGVKGGWLEQFGIPMTN